MPNDTGARQPEHTFHQPVPIAARIVSADNGVAARRRGGEDEVADGIERRKG